MPNRILKESICTSENVDQLSAFQETVFYRLIVNCDDYGRMDARPKLLSSKLFPLKDIRAAQIEDALRALTSAELVTLYEVDGKPFLQMNTWDRHQQVRAKKSKYPAPDDGNITSVSNCKQMLADDSKCPRNPIQSESESENESNTKSAHTREDHTRQLSAMFDRFWNAYPRHTSKEPARKAFAKVDPDEALLAVMLDAIGKQKQSAQWSDPQYIPHPSTWLNQRRWEDEALPAKVTPQNDYEQRDYQERKPGQLPAWLQDMMEEENAG